jgi:hypothetical protein
MINQGNDVPEKTIAIFMDPDHPSLTFDKIQELVVKPPLKRDWLPSHAYNCLPVNIANQSGFVISANFGFNVIWNGGDAADDIQITYIHENNDVPIPRVINHFGHGVISISTPFVFRTPPMVNLMTVNPPNYVLENITVLTGTVEADNIRMPFTMNWRIQKPNIFMSFPKGTPLSGIIPIPRHFCDEFKLEDASNIFNDDIMIEEIQALKDHEIRRSIIQHNTPMQDQFDKLYYKGKDIYENSFPEHQTKIK